MKPRHAMVPTILITAVGLVTLSGCVATTLAPAEEQLAEDCAAVQEAGDCGGVNKLVEQAKREGRLVISGDPNRATPLVTIAERFSREYSIDVSWADTGSTAQERFAHANSSSDARQPDVFALDPGEEVDESAPVTPYRVASFDERIPPRLRDPDGRWVRDFGGVMAIGYTQDALGADFAEHLLTERVRTGSILVAGDSISESGGIHAVIMMNALVGATTDSADGLSLLADQPLAPRPLDLSKLSSGRVTVVLDWSYQQAAITQALKSGGPRWTSVVPTQAEVTGWHSVAINQRAPHPAAARLWEEYLLGAGSQNYLLGMGAMPASYVFLAKKGLLNRNRRDQMPVLTNAPYEPTPATVQSVRALAEPVWDRLHRG